MTMPVMRLMDIGQEAQIFSTQCVGRLEALRDFARDAAHDGYDNETIFGTALSCCIDNGLADIHSRRDLILEIAACIADARKLARGEPIVWRALPTPIIKPVTPVVKSATRSTVEAVMLSLRDRGIMALRELVTRARLSELSSKQRGEVATRLNGLRENYPHVTDELLGYIRKPT